jgi:hypothetical protein
MFRVLVFGDYQQDLDRLRDSVEDIQARYLRIEADGQSLVPWEIIVPKCNGVLVSTDLSAVEVDRRLEILSRCSMMFDTENHVDLDVDLVIGIRQGATFVTMLLSTTDFQAKNIVLVGGDPKLIGINTVLPSLEDSTGRILTSLSQSIVRLSTTSRVLFANHQTDLIVGCPPQELERLTTRYIQAREALIHGMMKRRFIGYTELNRTDLEELLDEHQRLIVEHEVTKQTIHREMAPMSYCFEPSAVVIETVADDLEVITESRIIALIAGMLRR